MHPKHTALNRSFKFYQLQFLFTKPDDDIFCFLLRYIIRGKNQTFYKL